MPDIRVDARQFKRIWEERILASPCKNEHIVSLIYPVFAKVFVDFWCVGLS